MSHRMARMKSLVSLSKQDKQVVGWQWRSHRWSSKGGSHLESCFLRRYFFTVPIGEKNGTASGKFCLSRAGVLRSCAKILVINIEEIEKFVGVRGSIATCQVHINPTQAENIPTKGFCTTTTNMHVLQTPYQKMKQNARQPYKYLAYNPINPRLQLITLVTCTSGSS